MLTKMKNKGVYGILSLVGVALSLLVFILYVSGLGEGIDGVVLTMILLSLASGVASFVLKTSYLEYLPILFAILSSVFFFQTEADHIGQCIYGVENQWSFGFIFLIAMVCAALLVYLIVPIFKKEINK